MDVKNQIISILKNIENEFNVKIVYSVERGCNAWGLRKSENKYFIQFIYVQEVKEYLRIDSKEDTLDYQFFKDNYFFDFQGWDIKKALLLYQKSNFYLNEYLNTPVIYGTKTIFNGLPIFNSNILKEDYGDIIKSLEDKILIEPPMNLDGFFKGSFNLSVEYCYMVRLILIWSLLDKGIKNIPINFMELLELCKTNNIISLDLMEDINDLINYFMGESIDDIRGIVLNIYLWIQDNFIIIKSYKYKQEHLPDMDIFNNRFYNILLLI